MAYHDEEWGVPLHDDDKLFEFLILEGFQAGLSWSTILNKREAFREAFDNFEAKIIAEYDDDKVTELLQNKGIIRNKLKIKAAIKNAKVFLRIQAEHGSFDKYIWQFTNYQTIQNHFEKDADIPATTDISDKMSKQLKKDGFSFVGSTICYAFMQATGMVNDHVTSCFRYQECCALNE
jgi:DNA-3-methyladenine glycosylase I